MSLATCVDTLDKSHFAFQCPMDSDGKTIGPHERNAEYFFTITWSTVITLDIRYFTFRNIIVAVTSAGVAIKGIARFGVTSNPSGVLRRAVIVGQ